MLVGVIIVLACVGGVNVYSHYKIHDPVMTEVRYNIVREKMEALGRLELATSEQRIKAQYIDKVLWFTSYYNLDQTYRADYIIDLDKINIKEDWKSKSVLLEIDKKDIIMTDPVLVVDNSNDGRQGFISHSFTTEERQKWSKNAKQKALEKFKLDNEFSATAIKSLEETLTTFIKNLGYTRVQINILNKSVDK